MRRGPSACVRSPTVCRSTTPTNWAPACAGSPKRNQSPGREQLAPRGRKDISFEYTQRHPDDKEAVEGQGPIALHGLEHLVSSDKGVMLFRKLLRAAIGEVREGRDPKGILRDALSARRVGTSAGSVVRD